MAICASNYDSDAKKDDGSCRGCRNSRANNYCSSANLSDNTCECSGDGFLIASNKSTNTLQRLMIDGVNFGSLDPGEETTVRIAEGTHDLEFQSIGGSGGCYASKLVIVECDTESRTCSY